MASAVLRENVKYGSSIAYYLLPQLILCGETQPDLTSVTNITKKTEHTHIKPMTSTTN